MGNAFFSYADVLSFILTHSCGLKLLDRCKNIDLDDYNRMKDAVQQMQVGSKFCLCST